MPKIITDLGLLYYKPSKKRVQFSIFECIHCGNSVIRKSSTKKPTCKYCMGKNAEKHGLWSSALYRVYAGMIKRCKEKGSHSTKYYLNKGIKVCDEWALNYRLFELWAKQNGYKEGLSIERLDNNLGYAPENCTWIEKNKQPENRGKFANNTSGFMGVSYQEKNHRYKAYANINKKQHYLGMFKTAIEAAKRRDQFVIDNKLNLNLNFK